MCGKCVFCSGMVLLLLSSLDTAYSLLELSQEPYPQQFENVRKNSKDDSEAKEMFLGLPNPIEFLLPGLFRPEASVGYSERNGPNTWPERFPTYCAGSRQSGIDITLANAVLLPTGTNPAFSQFNYDVTPLSMKLANKGLTLAVTGNWPPEKLPIITGPTLSGEYGLAEIHFHWGENSREGSEHKLNGRSFPLEMHVVHYKLEYGSFEAALSKNDGLAVIAYFFEIQKERNQALQRLLTASVLVRDPKNSPVPMIPFAVNMLAPTFTSNYVSYHGSLTTPKCNEVVTWIVNLKTLGVSLDQIAMLRKLMNTDGRLLLKNFRPVQPLNGRQIIYVP